MAQELTKEIYTSRWMGTDELCIICKVNAGNVRWYCQLCPN